MKQPDEYMQGLYELDLKGAVARLGELLDFVNSSRKAFLYSRRDLVQDPLPINFEVHDAMLGTFFIASLYFNHVRSMLQVESFTDMQSIRPYIDVETLGKYAETVTYIINAITMAENDENQDIDLNQLNYRITSILRMMNVLTYIPELVKP